MPRRGKVGPGAGLAGGHETAERQGPWAPGGCPAPRSWWNLRTRGPGALSVPSGAREAAARLSRACPGVCPASNFSPSQTQIALVKARLLLSRPGWNGRLGGGGVLYAKVAASWTCSQATLVTRQTSWHLGRQAGQPPSPRCRGRCACLRRGRFCLAGAHGRLLVPATVGSGPAHAAFGQSALEDASRSFRPPIRVGADSLGQNVVQKRGGV